jgi:hypothetical protein
MMLYSTELEKHKMMQADVRPNVNFHVGIYSKRFGIFSSLLVLTLVLLILGPIDKLLTGIGRQAQIEGLIALTGFQIIYARITTVLIFFIAVFISIQHGFSRSNFKRLVALWSFLIIFMWLRVPVLEGNVGALVRTLNFFSVIFAMSLLATNLRASYSFFLQAYIVMAVSNLVGLLLFLSSVPFSYFTDGYGIMFTGLYAHKDLLSTTAAIGLIISVVRLKIEWKKADALIFVIQLVTLMMASTLSSILGVVAAIFAMALPRGTFVFVGGLAILLPIIHPVFGEIATLLGRDPTFTGRTILWDFTIDNGMRAPIFGHGFVHISATPEWMQLLRTEFRSDTFLIPHSHSLWIESFDKFGLVGLAVVIWTMYIKPILVINTNFTDWVEKSSFALLSFWLIKSALTLPFLNSDTTAYLWVFALGVCVARNHSLNHQKLLK